MERTVNLETEERTSLYKVSGWMTRIAFGVFYVYLTYFSDMTSDAWSILVGLFLVARMADIFSTFIALLFGGIETNPSSDGRDIGKLVSVQSRYAIGVILITGIIYLFSPWLASLIVFVVALTGFEACVSNLLQTGMVFVLFGLEISIPNKAFFYGVHVLSIVLVCWVTTLFI